ncbi:MAG: HEAT repeat domain-containing protein, partial [Candidatus Hydrogenedentes bacterium]|nr:HEAT repeat domain-containing protein [Candidatus Hydrogenedentota bacterium]
RSVRATSAQLAGIAGLDLYTLELMRLINDRAVEYSAPAARTLARLGNRDVIPRLLSMVAERNEEKGEAAIFGLIRLGGEEVINGVKDLLPKAPEHVRFRLARVLLALDDPMGKEVMQQIMAGVPTLAYAAALELAARGDWDAMTFVRREMSEPVDPSDAIMIRRANAAATLIMGGDVEGPVAVLQELLRSNSVEVHKGLCQAITRVGKPNLLNILQSPIENVDQEIAMQNCIAAMALGRPEFRKRLLDSWNMP